MRGGLRSWKRGADARGIRNALSYAFDGSCDAHRSAVAGTRAAEAYTDGAHVTRFSVVDGAIARDELEAGPLRRWIQGDDPTTGEMRGAPRHASNSNLLLDGTINFPKSYSIAALLNPELGHAFEALQDRLRDRVIVLWQRELNARRGAGGRVREDITRLEAVELQHRRSRALDPHVHRHLWLNMRVQGTDGRWSSLDSRVAMKLHTVVNAEGELAARTDPEWITALAAHGYSIDPNGEIAELAHAVRPFSRRANQIESNRGRLIATWREHHPGLEPGLEDLHHIDEYAWAQDRPSKPAELDEDEWSRRVRDELTALDVTIVERRPPVPTARTRIADIDRNALAHAALIGADIRSRASSGRFSPWDVRAGVIRALANTCVVADRAALDELIDDVQNRALARAIDLAPDDLDKPAHIKSLMAEETVILKLRVTRRFAQLSHAGAIPNVEQMREVAGRLPRMGAVSTTQLHAASAVAGMSGLVSITGPAGAGKTTLLRIANAALRLQGRRMILVAPTRKAALVAEREVGAGSSSLHALLADHGWRWQANQDGEQVWQRLRPGETDDSGRRYPGPAAYPLAPGDRIVVDEAGMVDLQAADALAVLAAEAHTGIAMIGDPRQSAPVGHSGAMTSLTRVADHAIELTAVHRFTDPDYGALTLRLRQVESADQALRVAAELEGRGRVLRVGSEDDARDAMVGAWFTASARHERTALVTATNEEAASVSEAIQSRRLQSGELRAGAAAAGRDGQAIYVGDLVQTRRNDRVFDVQNRATWIVTRFHDAQIELANVSDTTERRRVSTAYAAEHLHLAYAVTAHGVQGETTDSSVVGPGVNAAGLYVGLTRGRESNTAIVIASSTSRALDELASTMRRGIPEPTIEDSRRGVQIDLQRAARRVAPDPEDSSAPATTPAHQESHALI